MGRVPPSTDHVHDLHSHHLSKGETEASQGRQMSKRSYHSASLGDRLHTQPRPPNIAMELKDSLCQVTSWPLNHQSEAQSCWVVGIGIKHPVVTLE